MRKIEITDESVNGERSIVALRMMVPLNLQMPRGLFIQVDQNTFYSALRFSPFVYASVRFCLPIRDLPGRYDKLRRVRDVTC